MILKTLDLYTKQTYACDCKHDALKVPEVAEIPWPTKFWKGGEEKPAYGVRCFNCHVQYGHIWECGCAYLKPPKAIQNDPRAKAMVIPCEEHQTST